MRILLLPSAYAPAVGGVEELTSRLAEHLQSAGHAVEVWTNRHPSNLPAAEMIGPVAVRRFGFPLPSGSPMGLLRFSSAAPSTFARLLRAVRRLDPDVLHVQCFSSNGAWATLLSALTGVPLVVSLQGETVMDDRDIYEHSTSLRAALRVGLRRASAVTGCSQFVLDDAVARFGLRPGRGRVIFNGVEAAEHVAEAPVDVPYERFVLAYGRLSRKKGFDLLIDAFGRLAGEHPALGLVIGGEGPAGPELLELAERHGLADRVHFPGVLTRANVAWALRRAAVFVLPSRVEPFGIVTLEAMAAGCPAIVSSRGGAPEVVRHEREGLVVDPSDAAALAEAISRILRDRDLSRRLTDSGARRARELDWAVIAPRYVELYESVLRGNATPTAGGRS